MKNNKNKLFVSLFTLITLLIFTPVIAFAATSGPVSPYSFKAESGKGSGIINVSWIDNGGVNEYDLEYGTDPNNLTFGQTALPDAPNSNNTFTVGSLTPGVNYYFTLVGQNGGNPITSGPVSAKASGKVSGNSNVLGVSIGPNGMSGNTSTNDVLGASITSGPVGQYKFSAAQGSTPGSISLQWTDDGSSNKYDIIYGTQPGQYTFGLIGMPFNPNTSNTYIVGYLAKGVRYYFALVSEGTGVTSSPISAVAK